MPGRVPLRRLPVACVVLTAALLGLRVATSGTWGSAVLSVPWVLARKVEACCAAGNERERAARELMQRRRLNRKHKEQLLLLSDRPQSAASVAFDSRLR